MKHKIKFTDYVSEDECGTEIRIDGELLFYDGSYTFNCIEEILNKLGVDFEIEFVQEIEQKKIIKKKMKLVEDDDGNSIL